VHRKLGLFVILLATCQVALYSALVLGSSKWIWLFYFDPRIGWTAFFEGILRAGEASSPGIISWATAAVTLLVGVLLYRQPRHIKLYLISEVGLALPTLLFILLVAVGNVGSAHGFSVAELAVPVVVFCIYSVIPVFIAMLERAKPRVVG
jgi:hypothetical protein